MNLLKRKYFFGWRNIRRFFVEIINILSDKPSYFSQKRIQQNVAFVVLMSGCVFFLIQNHLVMSASDFFVWATVPASVASYTLYHTQKEKKPKEGENVVG